MASLGDFPLEATIHTKFTTRSFSTGAPTQLAGTPAVEIYKDNGTTQITAAETLTVDFDGITGLNHLAIAATAANGFEVGKFYQAILSAGTVGGVSVVGEVVAEFSIEAGCALRPATNGRELVVDSGGRATADVTYFGGAAGTFASGIPATNAVQISGDANAADNLESLVDGTGAVAETVTAWQFSRGGADQVCYFRVRDARTGAPFTGLAYNTSGLSCYYVRAGAAAASLTLATQTAGGAHSDGGLVEVSAANMPGLYRLDISDAIAAAGVDRGEILLRGIANMAPARITFELVDAVDVASGGVKVTDITSAALAKFFTVNSGETYGDAVAGSVVAEITDNAGGAGFTAADIADAVWDEDITGHTSANTAGQRIGRIPNVAAGGNGGIVLADANGRAKVDVERWLTGTPNALQSGRVDSYTGAMAANVITTAAINNNAFTAAKFDPDVANEISDQVWDEALSGHTTSGTAGERMGRIPNAAAGGNGGLPTVNASNYIAGIAGTINTLDALDTAQDTQHGNTMARLGAPVGATLSADIAAIKAETATILADTNELQTDWANGGRLDLILDARASQASVDTIDGIVDAITLVTAKLDTAVELDGAVYRFTTNALELAPTGSGASAETIAEAVWDYATADADTASSMGLLITTNIDAKISEVEGGGGGGGATAEEIWTYGTRVLTAATNITSTGAAVPITGGGLVSADMTAISTDATAANNLEAALDGTGGVTITAALTGNITGNLSGTIGSLGAQAKADVNAEVLDVLNTDTFAELTAMPAANAPLSQQIRFLFTALRNSGSNDGTSDVINNDAGDPLFERTVTDAGGTSTLGEWALAA